MNSDNPEAQLRRFLTDYSEIEASDGFTAQFSESQVDILKPLMPYRLPELVPCGISSCRTGHKRG